MFPPCDASRSRLTFWAFACTTLISNSGARLDRQTDRFAACVLLCSEQWCCLGAVLHSNKRFLLEVGLPSGRQWNIPWNGSFADDVPLNIVIFSVIFHCYLLKNPWVFARSECWRQRLKWSAFRRSCRPVALAMAGRPSPRCYGHPVHQCLMISPRKWRDGTTVLVSFKGWSYNMIYVYIYIYKWYMIPFGSLTEYIIIAIENDNF